MTGQQIPDDQAHSPAGGHAHPGGATVGSTPASILVEADVVAVLPQA